jgi:hypothetical protein
MAKCKPFKPFTSEDEDFENYMERFGAYMQVYEVKPEVKLPLFIVSIGKKAYEVLSSLALPSKPRELTYDACVTSMKTYFKRLTVSHQ